MNKYLGILFFPIRLATFLGCFVLFCLNVAIPIVDNYKIIRMGLFLAGFNLKYDEAIDNRVGNVVVFNHINMFDGLVMYSLFKKFPKVVTYRRNADLPIFSWIFKKLDMCIVIEEGGNTVEAMKKCKDRLIIAPDRMAQIPPGKYLADFKSGAFVLDKDVTPVCIRYCPSWCNIVWSEESLLNKFIEIIADGHIDIYVEILDEVKPNKEEVYNLMEKCLKNMPPQNYYNYYFPRCGNIGSAIIMFFIHIFWYIIYEQYTYLLIAYTSCFYYLVPYRNLLELNMFLIGSLGNNYILLLPFLMVCNTKGFFKNCLFVLFPVFISYFLV
jgi:1-acyl-sn-glycerol-3-phosphate acyltransferase